MGGRGKLVVKGNVAQDQARLKLIMFMGIFIFCKKKIAIKRFYHTDLFFYQLPIPILFTIINKMFHSAYSKYVAKLSFYATVPLSIVLAIQKTAHV